VNWLFLTKLQGQPEDATRSLAEAFGHGFDKTDEGLQIHGIVTTSSMQTAAGGRIFTG
jgi:protein SCO1/2